MIPMNNVKVIKLLELGVVPELLYAFQEFDILSSVELIAHHLNKKCDR